MFYYLQLSVVFATLFDLLIVCLSMFVKKKSLIFSWSQFLHLQKCILKVLPTPNQAQKGRKYLFVLS